MVVLADGRRVPAKCIELGDVLLSVDSDSGETVTVNVLNLDYAEDNLLEIRYEAGTLLCSVTHPLMVRREGGLIETPARWIQEEDLLVLEDLSTTAVLSVEPNGRGRVVMITTDGKHLYFAGDRPVLGHNATAPTKSATASSIAHTGARASGVGYGR